jgi:peroxiredoxin (alkyl hydroperoxide reductase subunit C)
MAALPIHTTRRTLMSIQTGATAPDFTLPSHTDQKVALASFKGRPVVVAFMPFAFTGG